MTPAAATLELHEFSANHLEGLGQVQPKVSNEKDKSITTPDKTRGGSRADRQRSPDQPCRCWGQNVSRMTAFPDWMAYMVARVRFEFCKATVRVRSKPGSSASNAKPPAADQVSRKSYYDLRETSLATSVVVIESVRPDLVVAIKTKSLSLYWEGVLCSRLIPVHRRSDEAERRPLVCHWTLELELRVERSLPVGPLVAITVFHTQFFDFIGT